MTARPKSMLVVALVYLAFAIGVLVTAYEYRGGSGLFPRFTGWLFVLLALMEVAVQARAMLTPGAGAAAAGGDLERAGAEAGVMHEARGFLWVLAFLVLVYLTGFMIAIPVYMFTYLYLSAGRKLWHAAVFAAGATLFVYILFIQLLEYRLYAGLLFGA